VVLLRKRIPQNTNLQTAAELGVRQIMEKTINQEREFLLAIYEATELNKLKWSICEESDGEVFSCDVSGSKLQFEFLYMQPVGTEGTIRAAILISGLNTYFYVFAGTQEFKIAINTLSLQISGWSAALIASNLKLEKATKTVRNLFA
jgi:hypothetical protein